MRSSRKPAPRTLRTRPRYRARPTGSRWSSPNSPLRSEQRIHGERVCSRPQRNERPAERSPTTRSCCAGTAARPEPCAHAGLSISARGHGSCCTGRRSPAAQLRRVSWTFADETGIRTRRRRPPAFFRPERSCGAAGTLATPRTARAEPPVPSAVRRSSGRGLRRGGRCLRRGTGRSR